MTATLSSADMVKILAAANGTVAEEYIEHELVCTQGAVPPDLDGILYRNGPGRLERGGVPYGHAFDGDGHVQRLACAGGRVRYTNRFVRTPSSWCPRRPMISPGSCSGSERVASQHVDVLVQQWRQPRHVSVADQVTLRT